MWEWRAFIPYTQTDGAGEVAPEFDVFAALGLGGVVAGGVERRTDLYFAPSSPGVGVKARHARTAPPPPPPPPPPSSSLEVKVVQATDPQFPGLALWGKHARLPWDGRRASLPAVVRGANPGHQPADQELHATARLLAEGRVVAVWASKARRQCGLRGVVVEQTECALECGDAHAPAGTVRTVCVEGRKEDVWEVVKGLRLPPNAQVVHFPEFINAVARAHHDQQRQQGEGGGREYCGVLECGNLGSGACEHCGLALCAACRAVHEEGESECAGKRGEGKGKPGEGEGEGEGKGEEARVDAAIAAIGAQGDKVRALKAEGASKERIAAEVGVLARLKDDANDAVEREIARLTAVAAEAQGGRAVEVGERLEKLRQFLPATKYKQAMQEQGKRRNQAKAKKEGAFDRAAGTTGLLCQRKIHSLMDHEGEGDTFRYFRRCRAADGDDGIREGDEVWLTEKLDGTTAQATNQGVFKRCDRMKKGNARWHAASDAERYGLERVDLDNRKNKYIARCVEGFLDKFAALPDGVCVYFEAVGQHIGKRFSAMGDDFYTLRVFDSTSGQREFARFGDTVALCERVGLPVVDHRRARLSLDAILAEFATAPNYSSFHAALEGYVVRAVDSGAALKIRVDDLPKIAAQAS